MSPRTIFAVQDKEPEDMTGKEILRRTRRLHDLGVPSDASPWPCT